jgi:hypothetical protein
MAEPAMSRIAHGAVLALSALLGLSPGGSLKAQTARPDAFSSLTIDVGATRFQTDSRLSRYYSPQTGFVVEASTPFELGELALTGERATFTSVGGVNPDFHGTLALLAWRYPTRLFGGVSARLGAHAGVMQFSFQDTLINAGLRKERELVMGVSGSLEARILSRLSAFIMGDYSHVWLHVPVHLARISAGVGYTTPTPGWLRDFLK